MLTKVSSTVQLMLLIQGVIIFTWIITKQKQNKVAMVVYFLLKQMVHFDILLVKDVPGGFPKSDLLGVTVALIHVVGQQFLAV